MTDIGYTHEELRRLIPPWNPAHAGYEPEPPDDADYAYDRERARQDEEREAKE